MRETTLAALDRQDVPYDQVGSAPGPPGPQIMVVHHEQAGLAEIPGLGAAFDLVPTGALPAELTVGFYEPRGQGPVDCVLVYDAELFDRATAGRLAGELLDILSTLRRNA